MIACALVSSLGCIGQFHLCGSILSGLLVSARAVHGTCTSLEYIISGTVNLPAEDLADVTWQGNILPQCRTT